MVYTFIAIAICIWIFTYYDKDKANYGYQPKGKSDVMSPPSGGSNVINKND